MVNRTVSILTLVATAALASACSSERQTTVLLPTTPSATSMPSTVTSTPSLVGVWTSTVGARMTLPASLSQCGNLQLTVSSQTPTQTAGYLTMDCPNGVTIAGNIVGQTGGATIPVVYQGAAAQGSESCAFTMNGTFFPIDATTFRFEFTGQSCFGPIYGTETLRLGGGSNPSPSPAPSPAPADPGPNAPPIEFVKFAKRQVIASGINPDSSECARFQVTKLAAHLMARYNPNVGLFAKPSGNNCEGYSVDVVAIQGGSVYDILGAGAEGPNTPLWIELGPNDPSRWRPAP